MASRRSRQRQGAKPWRDQPPTHHDNAEQSLMERLAEIGQQLAQRTRDDPGDGRAPAPQRAAGAVA